MARSAKAHQFESYLGSHSLQRLTATPSELHRMWVVKPVAVSTPCRSDRGAVPGMQEMLCKTA